MNGSDGAGRFIKGFATAVIVLGALLVVAWAVFWLLPLVGGPDRRMPPTLLESAVALMVIGAFLRFVLTPRRP